MKLLFDGINRHLSLGGWKDPKTILTCYQVPDPATMRAALAARRPLGQPPPTGSHTRGHTPQPGRLGHGG